MPTLMIYGANGYSGELIAREAKRRGFRPVLAGRNGKTVAELAQALKFSHRVFALDQPQAIDLSGIDVVLNCAGPFSQTAAAMMAACLQARVHYLDITGEISVFATAHALDASARASGVLLCPGVGFDVVPTDCLAKMLAQTMPDATELLLAFDAGGGLSRGTAKTSIEGLSGAGMARIAGKLTEVPVAWRNRSFAFDHKRNRSAMTIPWGDVYTAYVSTGIANISVYIALPNRLIRVAKMTRWLAPMLRFTPIPYLLKARINAGAAGPDANTRASSKSYVIGQVVNARGDAISARAILPNGYDVTVDAALQIAQRVLDGPAKVGFQTPATLCGADFLRHLAGTTIEIGPDVRI